MYEYENQLVCTKGIILIQTYISCGNELVMKSIRAIN